MMFFATIKLLIFRGDVVKAYQIKIQLEGLDVWRRVVMPAEVSFNALHRVIQYSMGWYNVIYINLSYLKSWYWLKQAKKWKSIHG